MLAEAVRRRKEMLAEAVQLVRAQSESSHPNPLSQRELAPVNTNTYS